MIMGFIPDGPYHLSFHNLLLSKAMCSLPSLKSFSRPLQSVLLRVTERKSFKCWAVNRIRGVLRVQTWRNGRCHTSSKLPPCLIRLSLCPNSHLKISIHIGHDLPGKNTRDFFPLFSVYLFPKCELILRRQATLTIKSSFTVSVNCSNSKIVEHSSQLKKIHKVLHSNMWLKSLDFKTC